MTRRADMIHGGDTDAGPTGNRYCERAGLASVPSVEDVLGREEVNLFHLMVLALLERGRPMAVEQIAERLAGAGAVAGSGDMVLSLKTAWHGREPVCRDPDGRLGLNLSSPELDRMVWHAGLRPPRFRAPEPTPVPTQPADEVPLTEDELTAAFHDRTLYGFSAHRQAAAVLDVRARPMAIEEVEAILAGMTRYRFPLAADRVRFWRSTLVTIDGNGCLALDRSSPDLGVVRRTVRKLARAVLLQHARHEHWAKVRVPAIVGAAMVDGFPRDGCVLEYYGFPYYRRSAGHRFSADDPRRLCEAVIRHGFDRVVVLDVTRDDRPSARSVECVVPNGS